MSATWQSRGVTGLWTFEQTGVTDGAALPRVVAVEGTMPPLETQGSAALLASEYGGPGAYVLGGSRPGEWGLRTGGALFPGEVSHLLLSLRIEPTENPQRLFTFRRAYQEFEVQVMPDGALWARDYDTSYWGRTVVGETAFFPPQTIVDNQWHVLHVTFEGTTIRIRLDAEDEMGPIQWARDVRAGRFDVAFLHDDGSPFAVRRIATTGPVDAATLAELRALVGASDEAPPPLVQAGMGGWLFWLTLAVIGGWAVREWMNAPSSDTLREMEGGRLHDVENDGFQSRQIREYNRAEVERRTTPPKKAEKR